MSNAAPLLLTLWVKEAEWEVSAHGSHVPGGQRHVHTRRFRKRRGDYSWNADGTRNDAGKFPKHAKDIKRARAIAAERLQVDPNILRVMTVAHGPCAIDVASDHDPYARVVVLAQ